MSLTTFISNTFGRWTGAGVTPTVTRDSLFPDVSEAPPDSRRLIHDRRYCHVLTNSDFDELSLECAWRALQHDMAFVPGGSVRIQQDAVVEDGYGYELEQYAAEPTPVGAFYLDRCCVSNSDYLRFVEAGGYDRAQLWPAEILSMVLQFTDSTGKPGPRYWANSQPPADRMDHPVVGICWYEASAYASWVGKRLPASEQWQRAGTWPSGSSESAEQRYTWGDAFDPTKANLWQNDFSDTLSVDDMPEGATPNGVRQLVGNVWEWVDAQYCPASEGEVRIVLDELLAEVRGGAFDTYFASQATCQFRSGNPVYHRAANVGFRCCVTADQVNFKPEVSTSEERL